MIILNLNNGGCHLAPRHDVTVTVTQLSAARRLHNNQVEPTSRSSCSTFSEDTTGCLPDTFAMNASDSDPYDVCSVERR
jgi:hypothetical protein